MKIIVLYSLWLYDGSVHVPKLTSVLSIFGTALRILNYSTLASETAFDSWAIPLFSTQPEPCRSCRDHMHIADMCNYC